MASGDLVRLEPGGRQPPRVKRKRDDETEKERAHHPVRHRQTYDREVPSGETNSCEAYEGGAETESNLNYQESTDGKSPPAKWRQGLSPAKDHRDERPGAGHRKGAANQMHHEPARMGRERAQYDLPAEHDRDPSSQKGDAVEPWHGPR